ncbi:MAG: flagellar basal body rod protein FlgC [Maricaulaceae bacterium]|nr:flagellar basal body rod protein FlgC [Maricaulaceae bacterium]
MSDSDAMAVAAMGMRAQSARMRIIAENLANAASTGRTADEDPYRRMVPLFQAELDRASGLRMVRMSGAEPDSSEFQLRFEPGHPAANADGYVRYPNVQTLVELMDMRDAQRAYEANLNMIENARRMQERALDLLRR